MVQVVLARKLRRAGAWSGGRTTARALQLHATGFGVEECVVLAVGWHDGRSALEKEVGEVLVDRKCFGVKHQRLVPAHLLHDGRVALLNDLDESLVVPGPLFLR